MPYYIGGQPQNNKYKSVAAGQTTVQISSANDGVPGRDYLERVIITYASSAAAGTVNIFDGTTSLLLHGLAAAPAGAALVYQVDLSVVADTTKGFNVTTGTSVSVVCIGRWS